MLFFLRLYTSFRPRTVELVSVLLLAVGINVVTGAAQGRSFDYFFAAGLAFSVSGAVFFMIAGQLEEFYEAGRRRSSQAGYEHQAIKDLAFGVARARIEAGALSPLHLTLSVISLVSLGAGVLLLGAHARAFLR